MKISTRRFARIVATLFHVVSHPLTSYRVLHNHYRYRESGGDNADLRFRRALHCLVGLDVELSFRRNNLFWTIAPGEDGIGEELFASGQYSGIEVSAVRTFIESELPGRHVVVDIGANIGTTTVPFAAAGYDVIAVEPVSRTARLLRLNVANNGFSKQVTILERAIAATRDTVEIAVSTSLGNSEVLETPSAIPGFSKLYSRAETITAGACALSDAVSSVPLDSIALVWSDTQGFEAEVVASGASLWSAGIPLYAEFSPHLLNTHGGLDDFISLLHQHFSGFISKDSLLAGRLQPTPIEMLRDLGRELMSRNRFGHTDILLISETNR